MNLTNIKHLTHAHIPLSNIYQTFVLYVIYLSNKHYYQTRSLFVKLYIQQGLSQIFRQTRKLNFINII